MLNEYLKPARLVDSDSPRIKLKANDLISGINDSRAKAIAIHNFVRDEFLFGFPPGFDRASASATLKRKLGDCKAKTNLFVALLRSIGIPARIHFINIPRPVMKYVFDEKSYASSQDGFTHSFSEVELEGKWIRCDSYIIDRPFRNNAVRLCKDHGLEMGYGVHSRGVSDWDGESDTFVQLNPEGNIPEGKDLGIFADPEKYYMSNHYFDRMNLVERTVYALFRGVLNKGIERIRHGVA